MKVINADNLIMGRLASVVAKDLLKGEEVVIVNAEKSVISGSRKSILEKYAHRMERKSIINPQRFGPKFPRRPDGILKRAVRGMLPYKSSRGREAYKRLKVHVGMPEEYDDKAATIKGVNAKKLKASKYIEIGDISKFLGSKF
ncbi:MAG: 50S ribosomal protein L13 [Candidatus Hydrothermarchaeales archaeon]